MIRHYRTNGPKDRIKTGKYGLTENEFFCQSCGLPTQGKGEEVINEDGNKIRICKKCWKK